MDGITSRVEISGGEQAFVTGAADPMFILTMVSPLGATNNTFGFTINPNIMPLSFPSTEFPANASGTVGAILVGAGNNSSLYTSLQNRTFAPPPGSPLPTPSEPMIPSGPMPGPISTPMPDLGGTVDPISGTPPTFPSGSIGISPIPELTAPGGSVPVPVPPIAEPIATGDPTPGVTVPPSATNSPPTATPNENANNTIDVAARQRSATEGVQGELDAQADNSVCQSAQSSPNGQSTAGTANAQKSGSSGGCTQLGQAREILVIVEETETTPKNEIREALPSLDVAE